MDKQTRWPSNRPPNKAHLAALESLVEAINSPALPEGFGAPSSAPELLRWMHQRLVRVEGADPRAGHVRAMVILAERMEAALQEALKALEPVRKPDGAEG